jgi:hypothetical protein
MEQAKQLPCQGAQRSDNFMQKKEFRLRLGAATDGLQRDNSSYS